jgi:hypothetical protein
MRDSLKALALALIITISILMAGALFVYFQYRKVITSGEFLGFSIGSSKEQVLERAIGTPWIKSIKVGQVNMIVVGPRNIEDVADLVQRDGIYVSYKSSGIALVFLRNGLVDHVATIGSVPDGLENARTMNEVASIIERGLSDGIIDQAFSIIKGYGPDFRREYVVINSSDLSGEERVWLFSHDYWRFNGEEDWTEVRLFFTGGLLSRIELIDGFGEF